MQFQVTNPGKFQINLQAMILFLITGIILAVVFFAYVNAGVSANDQKRLKDIEQMQSALKIYFEENGFYPASSNGVPKDIETYLSFWPTAPSKNGACTDEQNAYTYTQRPGTDYWISFCLGKGDENYAAGVHKASSNGIE